MLKSNFLYIGTGLAMFMIAGCGGSDEVASAPEKSTAESTNAEIAATSADGSTDSAQEVVPQMEIPSISLSGSTSTPAADQNQPSQTGSTPDESRRKLLEVMKPVQIMLGSWRGTTQKEIGDFKALDEPTWVWDFQSDRNQPAMVMTSEKSPYFQEARLTYLTNDDIFRLTTTDPEGKIREFRGEYSVPVEEFQGDDQKMHVKFKLELQQINAGSPRDTWQVTFNQQDNHRYLVELARKSGANFIRFDTIATQREGTSFAKSDIGYGERECIISGGLGTTQVNYKGKNYWVCCSGCKAAFDEDPTSWIAEYEEKKAQKDEG